MLALAIVALLSSAPAPRETATVFVGEGPPPTARVIAEAWAFVVPKAPALSEQARGEGPEAPSLLLAVPDLGRVALRPIPGALPEAELADRARRSLATLLSDTPLAPHAARIELVVEPDERVPRARRLDALVTLAAAVARASSAVAIELPGARVIHPAAFVINAVREGSALSVVWVGLELSGTTEDIALTSVGLARIGLMELQLGAPRRRVGQAIVTFYELVAELVRRGADVPDGGVLERAADDALEVRHVPGADGKTSLMRVELPTGRHEGPRPPPDR